MADDSAKDFAQLLLSEDNVCLTATDEFPFACRKDMALFSDGRYFVRQSRFLDVDGGAFYRAEKILKTSPYPHGKPEYVSGQCLEEIYKQAQKFSWYRADGKKSVVEPDKTREAFIAGLIKGNRCLSVVNPDAEDEMLSPDWSDYALFADGQLICSDGFLYTDKLQRLFPDLNIRRRNVQLSWIFCVYEALKTVQPTARGIYIALMKNKTRDLMRLSSLSFREALDLCAQITGWKAWKRILSIDEVQARHNVSAERIKQKIIADKYETVAAYDYAYYK